MEQKVILGRLAFSKYLIQKGNEEALKPEPLSSLSILHYHDALELSFLLVLEDKNIKPKDMSFMTQYQKINERLKEEGKDQLSLKTSLGRLKDRRVNLKHKGLFPSKTDIEESRFTANSLFEELCKNVYGLNVEDISLVELIANERVRDYVKAAVKSYPEDQKTTGENLAISFEILIKDYEKSKRGEKGIPLFDLGDIYFEQEQSRISYIERVVEILALGLDYRKYVKFKNILPKTEWGIKQGVPIAYASEDFSISQEDFDFCVSYIVECALKLQEFDFEIENKGAS